jgi:hypothetical protein
VRSILGKEIRGDEGPRDTIIESSPSVVCCVKACEVQAPRIVQAQMDLALLRLVCLSSGRANVGLEGIETKGHNLENHCH